jgi:hypothetical protein
MATVLTIPNELLLDIAACHPHSSVSALTLTNRSLHKLLEDDLYKDRTPRHLLRLITKNSHPKRNMNTL